MPWPPAQYLFYQLVFGKSEIGRYGITKRKPLFLSGICFPRNQELVPMYSAWDPGTGMQNSCSCSMIALSIHHEHLILAFLSVFKVFPQTKARSLHGNAALGLNSCSVIMYSSLLHLQVCQQGGHGLVLQTHNCELELSFVPLLKGKQVPWWCEEKAPCLKSWWSR